MNARDIIAETAVRWMASEFDPEEPDDFDRLALLVTEALVEGGYMLKTGDGTVGRLEPYVWYPAPTYRVVP